MVTIESNIYNKTEDGQIILGANIIVYNSENNEVKKISIVDENELNNLKSQLDVIDDTYVKFSDSSSLSGRSIDNLLTNSLKDVNINATKLNGVAGDNYSQVGHTHDDRYFTESEINSKLNGKSDTSHSHTSWPSQSIGTYGTLYVNSVIRMCQFEYVRNDYTGFSSSTGSKLIIASSYFPSTYRPKRRVLTPLYRPDTTLYIDPSGEVYVNNINKISQMNINCTLSWKY